MPFKPIAVLAVATAFSLTDVSAGAFASGPVSHKAVYEMKHGDLPHDSDVMRAEGAMLYNFSRACDGWTVEHQTALQIQYAEGNRLNSVWSFVSWESTDGTRFRFRARQHSNGQLVQSLRGEANLDAPGEAGIARFDEPRDFTLDLPAGTKFSTHHFLDMIRAGQDDIPFMAATVFDGATLENPYEISAFIRDVPDGEGQDGLTGLDLSKTETWDVRMAFFPVLSPEEQPVMEVGVRYRDDGVATRILQDFGDFSVSGKLTEVTYLEQPDC